jgi:hypothetical protein
VVAIYLGEGVDAVLRSNAVVEKIISGGNGSGSTCRLGGSSLVGEALSGPALGRTVSRRLRMPGLDGLCGVG